MSKDLEQLENFIVDMAAKGYIQIGEYLDLIDHIYNIKEK